MTRAQFIIVASAVLAIAVALSALSSLSRPEAPTRPRRVAVDQVPRPLPPAARALPPLPRRPRDSLPSPALESPPTQAVAVRDEPAKASPSLPPLIGGKPVAVGAAAPAPKERPLAREALALVGADPIAEAVWYDAINDPERSAHERSDLIEDLNEDGFPDPKHITPDDLPLIESRIALIEQLAPDAMDEVNFAAFAEAYKDLVNMYVKASGM